MRKKTIVNGWTDTYCALDHVSEFTFDQLFNDYFGTPGATDDRVWHTKAKNVVCIDSLFSYNKTVSSDKHNRLAFGEFSLSEIEGLSPSISD